MGRPAFALRQSAPRCFGPGAGAPLRRLCPRQNGSYPVPCSGTGLDRSAGNPGAVCPPFAKGVREMQRHKGLSKAIMSGKILLIPFGLGNNWPNYSYRTYKGAWKGVNQWQREVLYADQAGGTADTWSRAAAAAPVSGPDQDPDQPGLWGI